MAETSYKETNRVLEGEVLPPTEEPKPILKGAARLLASKRYARAARLDASVAFAGFMLRAGLRLHAMGGRPQDRQLGQGITAVAARRLERRIKRAGM